MSNTLLILIKYIQKNIFVSLSISFYLILVSVHLNDILVYDESAFVVSAVPLTCHPPLYVGIMYLLAKIFGNHEFVFRGFGVVTNLFAAYFIYQIAENIKQNAGKYALFIYLLLPVIVQGSLLIDIDNTLLNFLLIFLIYFYLFHFNKEHKTRYIYLTALIVLLFWSKSTTTYIFGLVLPLYEIMTNKKKSTALYVFVSFFIGCLFSFVLLYITTLISGLNFYEATLSHNSVDSVALLTQLISIKFYIKLFYNINIILLWASPYFFLIIFCHIYNKKMKVFFDKQILFLYLIAIFITLPYLLIQTTAAGFPKYVYPVFSIFAILAGITIFESGLFNEKSPNRYRNIFLALLFAVIFFIMGDPLKAPHYMRSAALSNINISMLNEIINFYLVKYFVIILLLSVFWFINRKKTFLYAVYIMFIAYTISLNLHQFVADYNVRYTYGEKGFNNAINYFLKNNISYDKVLGRYDVQYYLSNKKILNGTDCELVISCITNEELERKMNNSAIEYLCVSKNDLSANKQKEEIINTIYKFNFDNIKQFDDFIVYGRSSNSK